MTPPSRVLIVTPHYPPNKLGGTELRARKLAKGLVQRGSDAQVLCVESVSSGRDASCHVISDDYEGIRVHRLALTRSAGPPGFKQCFDYPLIENAIEEVILNEQIDLVHLISGYLVTAGAIRVAHRHNLPAVVTLTDYWFVCPRINLIRSNGELCAGPAGALDCTRCLLSENRRFRWPERALPRLAGLAWRIIDRVPPVKSHLELHSLICSRIELLIGLLNEADAVTIPTNSLRPRLVRAGARDRFALSRHSLDFDLLDYSRATPKSTSSTLRFGYMGQIQSIKGVDLMIDAFRKLSKERPDVSLAVWGDLRRDRGYVAKLEAMRRDTANVKLCGHYEPADLPAVMADVDVLIVPSRWPEIGPFVILEAFATRTPVIAANIGNMPELVEHGISGLLFDSGDSTDLHRQMKRIVADRSLLQRLTEGIPRVRTMSDEMAEILELYAQTINARKGDGNHACA